MRILSGILATVAIGLAVSSAKAQSATSPAAVVADSASVKTEQQQPGSDAGLKELEKAAMDLSRAVEAVVARAASSPELKTSALKVAAGAVSVAQQSLADQLKTIENLLNAAARQIAAAQVANAQKAAPSVQGQSK